MRLRCQPFISSIVLAAIALAFSVCANAAVTAIAATPTAAPATAEKAGAHNYRDKNFDYFVSGDPAAPRAAHTELGLALMGGGGAVDAAYRFIATHAGGGHILILRAVSDDSFDPTDGDIDDSFLHTWGPVTSAQTIVFHNREAAFDTRVVAALHGADGIFLAGGDQGNYLRYWKGTPVQTALNEHVAANRPIGGSSAGLAILGRYSYTCLDGNSMESKNALADPFNTSMTLESDFLHYRWMENVMTDTHFSARHRLGRLITFVARFNADLPGAKTFGIGVDEKTAVLVGADGIGRIAAGSVGSAWLVMPQQPATTLAKGQPLSIKDVRIVRLDGGSSIDLKTRAVQHAAAEATISILHGKPTADSIASPILQRGAPLPNET